MFVILHGVFICQAVILVNAAKSIVSTLDTLHGGNIDAHFAHCILSCASAAVAEQGFYLLAGYRANTEEWLVAKFSVIQEKRDF